MTSSKLSDLGLTELDKDLQTKISELALIIPWNNDANIEIWIEVDKFVIRIEQTIDPIEILKLSNHPKAKALYDWLILSNDNIVWYKESLKNDTFWLVENWIRLWSSFFFLEDESEPIHKGTIITHKSSFNLEQFKNYTSEKLDKTKKVPYKWKSYIDALPWNDENKILFFINVLWLNKWFADEDWVFHISYWSGLVTYDWKNWEDLVMVYKEGERAYLGEGLVYANSPRIRCIKNY